MRRHLSLSVSSPALPALLALLVHAATGASQQAPAGNAAIAGIVVNAVTGEPLANVEVTLARTDMPVGAFSQMFAGGNSNTGAGEVTLPGEMLSTLLAAMSEVDRTPATEIEKAQTNARAAAIKALPLADIREVIVSAEGTVAVVRKSLSPVKTDNAGRFSFDTVEPGTYRALFMAPGYAKQDYGQRILDGRGTPIVARAGERTTDLIMRLIPTGAVSGTVRNTDGQPLAGIQVELLRFSYNETGQMGTRRTASSSTDDRGQYRMYYLAPGRYYLSARSAGSGMRGLPGAYISPNRLQENYGLHYYPGVPNTHVASTIEVRPGTDITGIDVTVSTPQSYRIQGRVVDRRAGAVPARASVRLLAQDAIPDLLSGSSPPANFRPQDGSFEFVNVAPGAYTLNGYISENDIVNLDRPAVVVPIVVSNTDIEGFSLEIGNIGSLTGTLRSDPAAGKAFAPSPLLQVHLTIADAVLARALGNRGPQQWQAIQADGRFELSGLRYGEYYVSVKGLPPGFYLKEARFEQADVLNTPLRFSGTTTSVLELVVSPNSGAVAGVANNNAGQPLPGARVVLIPAANRERTELFKAATTDLSGAYSISYIAPGDYILAAWEAIEPYAFFDPELIREAESTGTRIRIAESTSATMNVTAR
jgi:5-hydroxyisourate hydrolase-like protein (transthyretin family)